MKPQTFTFAPSTIRALETIKKSRGINKSRYVETAVIIMLTLERFAPEQAIKLSEMIDPNQIDMMAEIEKAIPK